MELYGLKPSPYESRVRLALRCKGLAFETAPPAEVDPARSPFLAPSPMEQPTLVADDCNAASGSGVTLAGKRLPQTFARN